MEVFNGATSDVVAVEHSMDSGEFEFEFGVNGELTEIIQKIETDLRLNDILVESYKVEVEPPASMIKYDVEMNAIRAALVFRYPRFYMHALVDILQVISDKYELKSCLRTVEGISIRR